MNSSDHDVSDVTKTSEEVTGYFSNLQLESSQDYEIVESSYPNTRGKKRQSSLESDPVDALSSQPVIANPKLKRKKSSITKRVIQADSFA